MGWFGPYVKKNATERSMVGWDPHNRLSEKVKHGKEVEGFIGNLIRSPSCHPPDLNPSADRASMSRWSKMGEGPAFRPAEAITNPVHVSGGHI